MLLTHSPLNQLIQMWIGPVGGGWPGNGCTVYTRLNSFLAHLLCKVQKEDIEGVKEGRGGGLFQTNNNKDQGTCTILKSFLENVWVWVR